MQNPSISRKYIKYCIIKYKNYDHDMQGETVTSVITQPLSAMLGMAIGPLISYDSTCLMIKQHDHLVINHCFLWGDREQIQ